MEGLYTRVARRRHAGQAGFTLIELLVVIAVLAILAAIVLFNVVGVTNRGQTQACATDVRTFQTATDAAIGDALSDGNPQPDSSSTAGKLTANASGVNSANIAALNTGGYIHDGAGTSACANNLTFTFNSNGNYIGGITVAGN